VRRLRPGLGANPGRPGSLCLPAVECRPVDEYLAIPVLVVEGLFLSVLRFWAGLLTLDGGSRDSTISRADDHNEVCSYF
jgi:hypothetical protein